MAARKQILVPPLVLHIDDTSVSTASKPKKKRSFQSNTETRALRNRHYVHRNENTKECEVYNFQTTFGKRRTSLPARATIHPATRLASVANRMEAPESFPVSTKFGQLEEPHTSISSTARDTNFDTNMSNVSRLTRNDRILRSQQDLLNRDSIATSRRTSVQKVSNIRTLRPRYPRTPTPETALLLNPKLSAARHLRSPTSKTLSSASTRTLRTSRSSVPCSPKVGTPKSRLLNSPKVSTPNSRTPKIQTPKSGHKNTPKSLKAGKRITPRTPRTGTPKGTPKSHKMEQSFVCEVCDVTLTDKKAMLRHQRYHGRSKTDDKSFTPNKATLVRTPKTRKNPQSKFECDVCQKLFRFQSNLKSHKAIHEEQRIFECHLCQKNLLTITLQNGSLVIKQSMVEKSEPNAQHVVCNNCCYGKKHPGDFEQHVPRQGRVKRLMCDKCARTFASESNLKIHMKTHTIDKIRDILKATSSRFAAE